MNCPLNLLLSPFIYTRDRHQSATSSLGLMVVRFEQSFVHKLITYQMCSGRRCENCAVKTGLYFQENWSGLLIHSSERQRTKLCGCVWWRKKFTWIYLAVAWKKVSWMKCLSLRESHSNLFSLACFGMFVFKNPHLLFHDRRSYHINIKVTGFYVGKSNALQKYRDGNMPKKWR